MSKPYSMELRERAVRFVSGGQSRRAVAARLGVGASSVIKWLARFDATGSAAPGKVGGHRPPKIMGEDRAWLLGRIAAGDFTLQGLADELDTERGVKVDYRTMWNFVHRERLSFKKKRSRRRAAKG
jgi:putative transposase